MHVQRKLKWPEPANCNSKWLWIVNWHFRCASRGTVDLFLCFVFALGSNAIAALSVPPSACCEEPRESPVRDTCTKEGRRERERGRGDRERERERELGMSASTAPFLPANGLVMYNMLVFNRSDVLPTVCKSLVQLDEACWEREDDVQWGARVAKVRVGYIPGGCAFQI